MKIFADDHPNCRKPVDQNSFHELDRFDAPAPWVIVNDEGAVLAVYVESVSGRAKPSVVMASAVA
jgi:hypothetical protein